MKKYFLLLSIVWLTACDQETEQDILTDKPAFLISSSKTNGKTTSRFIYDSFGRMAESQSVFYYYKFHYDGEGRLVKRENAVDPGAYSSLASQKTDLITAATATLTGYTLYEYDTQGQLAQTKNYLLQNGRYVWRSTVRFEYKNQRVAQMDIRDTTNTVGNRYTYQYDPNGNISEESYYSALGALPGAPLELINTKQFKYDQQPNPFQVFNQTGQPGIFTNRNNQIQSTSVFQKDLGIPASVLNDKVSKTTYEYNQHGYPIKVDGIHEYVY